MAMVPATFFDMESTTETVQVFKVLSASFNVGVSGPDNESESQTSKLRREKEALRRRQQRQRRNDERGNLRREEQELTLQLQKLKQACVNNVGVSSSSVQLYNLFWRDCAAREQREHLEAEEEQKRLVVLTRMQAKYIDNLAKLLVKRRGDHFDQQVVQYKRPCLASSDAAVFSALVRDIDDCYSTIDELFIDCGMEQLPVGIFNTVHRRETDGEVEYIQHVNKEGLQPFNFEHTYSATWKIAAHLHRQLDREEYTDVADRENTIAVKFRLIRTLATGTTLSVLQRLVLRRFFGEKAVFHVWKIYSEGEGLLRGMHSDETGWCRFRPSEDGFATHIEVCVRQVPALFTTTDVSSPVVEDFHQMLKEKVDEDQQKITAALGNVLLEDTLAFLDM